MAGGIDNLTPFKPGHKGMGGRPRGKSLKTILASLLGRDIPRSMQDKVEKALGEEFGRTLTYYELVALGQVQKAVSKRDTFAARELFDRMEGKAHQSIGIGITPDSAQEYFGDLAKQMRERDAEDDSAAPGSAEEPDVDPGQTKG